MAWAIGASQVAGWAIGASQVEPAAPGGGSIPLFMHHYKTMHAVLLFLTLYLLAV